MGQGTVPMSRPKIKMSGRIASLETGELCLNLFVAHKSQERKGKETKEHKTDACGREPGEKKIHKRLPIKDLSVQTDFRWGKTLIRFHGVYRSISVWCSRDSSVLASPDAFVLQIPVGEKMTLKIIDFSGAPFSASYDDRVILDPEPIIILHGGLQTDRAGLFAPFVNEDATVRPNVKILFRVQVKSMHTALDGSG